jgi:hypothetical protein
MMNAVVGTQAGRTTETLGARFAHALADMDFVRITDLLEPEVDFRALTPSRAWEAQNADAVISDVLSVWFSPQRQIETLTAIREDSLADRQLVGYRCTVRTAEGPFIFEQQAYYSTREERIDWMRVLCSGLRPLER